MNEVRNQMETSFFGPVRLIKSALPHMRARGSGTIINGSSAEGVAAAPGIGIYGASKHALEGLSEALFAELSPFGIQVPIVEPGGMRTKFLDPKNIVEASISAPYQDTPTARVMEMIKGTLGMQMLDPKRSAQRIVEAVTDTGTGWLENRAAYMRLPLGKEVIGRIDEKLTMLQKNIKAMEKIWSTVDYDT